MITAKALILMTITRYIGYNDYWCVDINDYHKICWIQ